MGWVAVLIGSLLMMFFDMPIIDPLLSLAIASFILFNVYKNLKPALRIILQGVPNEAEEEEMKAVIRKTQQVKDIHDFHLWSLDGEHYVVSVHVVVNESITLKEAEHLKEGIKRDLQSLNVSHATIEIEFEPEHDLDNVV